MSETELLFGFLVGLMGIAVLVIAMSVSQILRINKESEMRQSMKRLRGKNQPPVTVLVYAYNARETITKTLLALKNNRYRACDIVVIDDASSDGTSRAVKDLCAKYPHAQIRTLRRRARTSMRDALQAGYRKSKRGAVVIALTPEMLIDRSFIKRAVASKGVGEVWRVSLVESPADATSIFGISQSLERYYWQRRATAWAGAASAFTRMKPELENTQLETTLRAIVAVALFAGLVSAAYFSLGVKVFWYAWILVTAYGLVAVWFRYGQARKANIALTLSIPLALFLIPATGVVRGFSQLSTKK